MGRLVREAHEPWFLNSGRAVAFTTACLFVTSLISGWLRLSGLMIAAGATTAMTVVLFLKRKDQEQSSRS